jgi:hypothetical protein
MKRTSRTRSYRHFVMFLSRLHIEAILLCLSSSFSSLLSSTKRKESEIPRCVTIASPKLTNSTEREKHIVDTALFRRSTSPHFSCFKLFRPRFPQQQPTAPKSPATASRSSQRRGSRGSPWGGARSELLLHRCDDHDRHHDGHRHRDPHHGAAGRRILQRRRRF